jgi:eukaryotic-like serine/threonine-protein kinase
MGVVYRARDPIINRLVALKTITTAGSDNQNLLERFYREAQSAGGLQHPNIVTIFDMGDEAGVPYIAMELIEGENLEQMISQRMPIPVSLKLLYAAQACSAFDYAHKRGIVHRDIKPGNIMVNKDGAVKVVDFGIARVLETSKTQTGMLIGTFAYMSPEQYHGEHADERSDIWSFGVLLYELLCYRRPFIGTTPAALMHSICSQDAPSLRSVDPAVPADLEIVASRLLQKSPGNRYQSMEDVLLELDPICKALQAESVAGMVTESRELAEHGEFSRARDLLRQALQLDSKNQTARMLLEKVNAELRRVTIRPKVQKEVEKGASLLGEGKLQEARAAAEGALQMDSSFEPAYDLQRSIQKELDRVQRVADWIDGAKEHLAEGMPDEAETLLAKVIEVEPANTQANKLLEQAAKEKKERRRRLEFIETMQGARGLWTQQKYSDCIQVLTELQNEYPEEEEIPRLLQTAREDQAEQEKRQNLDKARNLLAARHYDECRSVLADLQKRFPTNEEISDLIRELKADEEKQRKLLRFAEARGLLAARRFEDCITLSTALQKEYPAEVEAGQLLVAARQEQLEERKHQGLSNARELRASRQYREYEVILEELRKQFPNDEEIPRLLQERAEEQKVQRKQEIVAEARKLLTARNHKASITLLNRFLKEFPGDSEVEKFLHTVHEDEAQQRKLHTIAEARNMLASRRFDESIAVLTQLQKTFPADDDITKLLHSAHEEQEEVRKQQKLSEARSLLVAEKFDEALALIDSVSAAYPKDTAVQKLRAVVSEDKEKHAKAEKLKSDIATVKKLVGSKKYPEVIARAESLLAEHPGGADLARLIDFARSQQAEIDRELAARKALDEGKSLLAAARYADAASTVRAALKADPADHDLQKLLEQIETEKKKSVTRQDMERRIREIKFKINREKFSEAVDLAKQTIANLGPDTDVTQLLNSAHVEMEARERKRQQEKAIENIRGFVNSRDFDGATKALDAAIATKIFEAFDSRAQRAADEISAGRKAAQLPLEPSSTPTLSQDFRNEYAFQQGPPSSDAPPKTSTSAAEVTGSHASAIQPSISAQPSAPAMAQPTQPSKPSQVTPPKPEGPSAPMKSIEPVQTSQTVSPLEPPAKPDEPIAADKPVKLEMIASPPVFVSPKRPVKVAMGQPLAPVVRPASEKAPPKKPLLPALIGLALAAAVAAGYFLWPHTPPPKAPEVAATKTAVVLPPANPLEVKQRDAMVAAEKLVAANDLEKARQTVLDAENLNGPLTPALQSMRGQIEESMRNAQLRQLRQHEAQLWQQAVGNVGAKQFAQAEAELRQVEALPDGGVHREDAQRYLTEVIPRLKQQGKRLTEARQSLKQGDFESARKFSSQLQQSGGDATELNGEIEKSEGDRLAQLESQFNQLKQGDDDSSVQQLKALQPKFQALVNSGGPRSAEAQSYVNSIQSSISDIQARAQSKRFELAFQAASQKCQQVLAGNDKSGLASARESMQSFTQNGPHGDEAQKCVGDITAKLNALNQPPAAVLPPPPAKRETQSMTAADETAARSVVQTFFRAFEERNPDELRQVWPTIPQKTYDGYKRSFADASVITMQIVNQTVNVSPDGATATVSAESQQRYTSKAGKTAKKSEASWKFQLGKKNGVWVLTDVQ